MNFCCCSLYLCPTSDEMRGPSCGLVDEWNGANEGDIHFECCFSKYHVPAYCHATNRALWRMPREVLLYEISELLFC